MTTSVMSQPSSPDPQFLTGLARRSRLELGAYETTPRTARGHIAQMLEEWSLPQFRDVTVLIATELITNAIQQTAKYAWVVPTALKYSERCPILGDSTFRR